MMKTNARLFIVAGLMMAQCVNWCYNNKETIYQKGKILDFELKRPEVVEMWKPLLECKKFSNVYNAMTLPTKRRSMVIEGSDELDEEFMPVVEHNRWNVEELLLQFRPATEEELAEQKKVGKTKDADRGIHTCILPYGELDKSTREYDEMIIKVTDKIQKTAKQWITSLNR